MSKPVVSPSPLTGRKVLLMLVAFFGVVIGVNVIMMKLAIQTLPGTEVDSAYSASLVRSVVSADTVTALGAGLRNIDRQT